MAGTAHLKGYLQLARLSPMRLVSSVVIAILLAGCSSGGGEIGNPSPTSSSVTTTAPPPIVEVPAFTDTQYLQANGKFTVASPSESDGFRIRMAPDSELAETDLKWTMDRPELSTITANGTLWYEITGAVYNTGNDCFIGIQLFVEDSSGGAVTTHCVSGTAIAAPGIYHADFTFTWPIESLQGNDFGLSVGVGAIYGLDGDVSLLGGSTLHPSHLTIAGLQLPLENGLILR